MLEIRAFRLFVSGRSSASVGARNNLKRALAQLGRDADTIEIIDVYERPDLAAEYRIFVTPTLLRIAEPADRLIGDLSALGQLLDFLG
jgi:hypothetical protein